MDLKYWIEFCTNQHDVVCNQKYNDTLPYSFHLDAVSKQGLKFIHLLKDMEKPYVAGQKLHRPVRDVVLKACWGHDLIEDARVTYNDIVKWGGADLADIIYCCTDEKGRNRSERHSDKFYEELAQNKLAVYVKLSDVIANVKFSLLNGSSMYEKYQKDFPKIKEKLYRPEYDEMFVYLEKLLTF
jgi:hypothetical protein